MTTLEKKKEKGIRLLTREIFWKKISSSRNREYFMQLADANERRAFCGAFYYIMPGADPAARNFNATFSYTKASESRYLSVRVRVAREEVSIGLCLEGIFFFNFLLRYIVSSCAIRDRRNRPRIFPTYFCVNFT